MGIYPIECTILFNSIPSSSLSFPFVSFSSSLMGILLAFVYHEDHINSFFKHSTAELVLVHHLSMPLSSFIGNIFLWWSCRRQANISILRAVYREGLLGSTAVFYLRAHTQTWNLPEIAAKWKWEFPYLKITKDFKGITTELKKKKTENFATTKDMVHVTLGLFYCLYYILCAF